MRNSLKCNGNFTGKNHIATLPRGWRRHSDDSIASCTVFQWFSYI